LQAKPATFSAEHHVYLKEQVTNNINRAIWQTTKSTNELKVSQPVTSKKTADHICCQRKSELLNKSENSSRLDVPP